MSNDSITAQVRSPGFSRWSVVTGRSLGNFDALVQGHSLPAKAGTPNLRQDFGIGAWSFTGHWSLVIGHSPRRAFTLIELILVMALLAIVMAVSAPALSNFFRGRTLASEARRFVSLARYGQSRAVAEGVPMMLWIDIRRGTYGLQQEPGYNEADAKAVDFALNKDLQITVADMPLRSSSAMQAQSLAMTDPNIPRLRFQPDGFVADTSPQTVVLRENTGESIWITQSRNRLNYEIATNAQNIWR